MVCSLKLLGNDLESNRVFRAYIYISEKERFDDSCLKLLGLGLNRSIVSFLPTRIGEN